MKKYQNQHQIDLDAELYVCVFVSGSWEYIVVKRIVMSMALDHGGRMIGFEGRGMEK